MASDVASRDDPHSTIRDTTSEDMDSIYTDSSEEYMSSSLRRRVIFAVVSAVVIAVMVFAFDEEFDEEAEEGPDEQMNESIENCMAALKDTVTLLSSTDPLFKPELEKHLETETAQVKEKVESWLQSVQPEY